MAGFTIGVDLGGTNMRVAAVEECGTAMEIVTTSTGIERGRDRVLREMAEAIRGLSARHAGSRRWLGVGVGVPGIIDLESGTVLSAANLPGWSAYPVKERLESMLGTSVVLENDANCAALGEKWIGAGREVEDLCMLTLGTGVGGGFVVKGRPWHGVMGMAGEFGHMTVIPDGVPCPCGSRGCLEKYASANAIRRMTVEAAAQGDAPGLARLVELDPDFTARAVFELAQQGDLAAQAIFETVGSTLGIALANLINALNLPLYVIGGGVAGAWEAFCPALFRELNRRSIVFRAGEPLKSRHRSTTITRSLLDESAGLIGAAHLPMLMTPPSCCSLAG
jgi:glucokinase